MPKNASHSTECLKLSGIQSNLIDCNAITQNKKGGNSNLIDCNAIVQKNKGGNSNLKDCNAIA